MPLRIGGLASGMDIDSIVNDLMKAERVRVDKVAQNKTLLEWTRDKYNEVNKMFADFILNTRQSFGLIDTASGSVINKSVSSLKWVKSALIGDSSIADVSARSNAIKGTYEVTIHQLAENWSAASTTEISAGTDKSNVKAQFNLNDDDVIDFTVTSGNGTAEQTVQVYIDNSEAYIKVTNAKGEVSTITFDGKNISNLSLKEIVNQINKANIGVTANYDESIDRFFLQTNENGVNSTIKLTDNGDFISRLKLHYDNGAGSAVVTLGQTYTGKNAVIDFGMAKGIEKSTNQFTINEIDFNLKATGSTTVKVDADEDAIVEKVKEFINKYNELVDKVDDILGEKRYRDYAPLTKEQKEAMSEKEIELWEEKAKSGLLRNDSILSRTMQTLRIGLYESVQGVEGIFDHLTEIGIETESYTSGSMGGKLKVDETKLRTAIRDDVDGVLELLFKEPDSGIADDKEKRKNTGLIGRMYGDLVAGMKDIIVKAGPGEDAGLLRQVNSTMLIDFVIKHSSISMLDESIIDYEKRISEMEIRLLDKENEYWRKFSAMETALQKMYSQSDWLYQQLGMSK